MNHGSGGMQVGDVVQLKNGDHLVENGVHYKKEIGSVRSAVGASVAMRDGPMGV
ncbi:hypothetical protein ACP3V3_02935 [Vibrio sp. PNB22_3_1]